MKILASVAVLVALASACGGDIADPNSDVATFTLTTRPEFDQLNGLFAKECIDLYGGPNRCTPYPNDLECDVLNILVKADGRTQAECRKAGQIVVRGFMGLAQGIPFVCRAANDLRCQVCSDLYGYTALDTCSRNTQAFRSAGSGWQNTLPDGAGFIPEPGQNPNPTAPTTSPIAPTNPTPATPTPATPSGTDACDWKGAITLYANALNKILKHDGLNFAWTPDASKFANPDGTILPGSQGASCEAFAGSIKGKLHQCPNPAPNGECNYCWQGGGFFGFGGSGTTCKCNRMNVAALEASCKQIPTDCNHATWSGALIMAYGVATKWLFSPSYGAFYGKVDVPPGEAPKFPKCQGSPLVLDLGGDGIEPTSNARGVKFDLLAVGAYKTAWVKGDDALLALDRNGNGRIDSGAELFGEATPGGYGDGFQALAVLDANGDGMVDSRDPRFCELRLWTDKNGDGVSQPNELLPLSAKGIRSLGVNSTVNPAAVDRFGNDLRLQGSFTRADGSRGLMIDVNFVGR